MAERNAPGSAISRPPRKARRAFLLLALAAVLVAAGPEVQAQARQADPFARIDSLVKAKDYNGALRALTDLAKATMAKSATDTSLESSQIIADAKSRYRSIVETGGKYDRLLEANFLIALKDYNNAVTFLTDFIKKNPDRFDEAQALLRSVVTAREEYNRTAALLLEVLKKDPTNEARKLELINKLQEVDPNPNTATKGFVSNVKEASLFVVNEDKYKKIFAQGRTFIDQGRYAEAAAAYSAGFILYRVEFNEGPSDDITKQAVAGLVDRVTAETSYFANSQSTLTAAVAAFQAALATGDSGQADATWPAAKEALEDRARRRDVVIRAGRALAQQSDAIKRQGGTVKDSSFLPFAFRFTLGTAGAAQPEGIAGAMDSQWMKLMGDLEQAYTAKSEALYAAAESAYDRGDWATAESEFRSVAELSRTGLPALALWSLVAPTEALPALSSYGRSVLTTKPAVYERARQLALSAESESALSSLMATEGSTLAAAKAYALGLGTASDLKTGLEGLAARRSASLAFHAAVMKENEKAVGLAAELARWKAQGFEAPDSARALEAWQARLATAAATGRSDEVAIVNLALAFEYAKLEAELAARGVDLAQARLLLDGSAPQAAAGGQAGSTGASAATAFISRFPSRSATALTALAQPLATFKAKAQDYLSRIAKESAWVNADQGVQSWATRTRELVAKADSLEADRAATLAKAREQKRQADSAKAEADLRMQQSRDALAKEDFDLARDRLDKAADRYLASLSLEDNTDLRAASDVAQQKLGADILKAENDKVIKDTRALITTAKSSYFQGNFTKAEDSLLQARTRWATTHGQDAEPEVEYWLRLAQAALSVSTGRTIAPTAPLYAEMSQLLSLARSDYEKGKNLLDQKKRDLAKAAFDSARARINQVKIVFPLNQEAGVLALKIDQIQDPATFRQQFAQRFADAKAGLKQVTNSVYADLQDLAKIEPNYPGLKDAIYQAEVGLGIRMPPPDPAKQKRANDLVAAARVIVDAGNTGQFSIALQQVNEAITLDPNNDQALALKDRIQAYQGPTAQIALSSASEELYRQAVQEFQAGNFLQANAIVTRLLQDPKNANSPKILDLSKKIKARL